MQSLEWVQRVSMQLVRSDLVIRGRGCERGATVIEYALIAALLAIMAIAGLNVFGSEMRNMYNRIGTAVQNSG